MHGHGGKLTKMDVRLMTTKNVNKSVEAVIEDIRNFDRQVDSSWNPTIETKKHISTTGRSFIEISINYDND